MKYIINANLSDSYPRQWQDSFKFDSLLSAKEYVTQNYPGYKLCNDDEDCRFGYRCRYLWGGYPEGLEIFILEMENE